MPNDSDQKRETLTVNELIERAKAQGVPRDHVAWICPMCGTVQSVQDLIKAGAGATFEDVERLEGFSCVGRFTGAGDPSETKGKGIGCDWTLGGLFSLHRLTVIDERGREHPRFELASPDVVQQHAAAAAAKGSLDAPR